jgi:hypothetical protein
MRSISCFPKFVFNDSRSLIEGMPVHINTLYIWFKVELPGKSGFPVKTSAIKHPKLQISIALE